LNYYFLSKKKKKGQLGIGNKENQYSLVLIKEDIEIKFIACGFHFSILYCSNGDLLMMGDNFDYKMKIENYNQLKPNLVMNDKTIISICCTEANFLILKENGEVFLDIEKKIATNIKSIHCGNFNFKIKNKIKKIFLKKNKKKSF
jgi:alpha-tubulin suppressor-like RCC1 family protein